MMASSVESTLPFSSWLADYLIRLNRDIDVEIYGNYIESLLKDATLEQQEAVDSIRCFLESILPSDLAIDGSNTIYDRFHDLQCNYRQNSAPSDSSLPGISASSQRFGDLEEQMRSILISTVVANTTAPVPSYISPLSARNTSSLPVTENKKTKACMQQHEMIRHRERDACTAAVLRSAGVSGYQGNEEAEAALKVVLADAEYFAEQAANGVGTLSASVVGTTSRSKGKMAGANVAVTLGEEEEEIDMEEIEKTQGYGRKEGIRPGNVMDALSTLNPGKFGSSRTNITATEATTSSQHLKRLPTPGDVNSSTTLGYLLLNSRGVSGAAAPTTSSVLTGAATVSSTDGSMNTIKKKTAPPSKHLADVGARAEERHKRLVAKKREKLDAFGVVGAARNHLDDMDAFFFSDDDNVEEEKEDKEIPDNTVDILPESQCNKGPVKEAEQFTTSKLPLEYLERRTERSVQQHNVKAKENKKTRAHQRSQKAERRCH